MSPRHDLDRRSFLKVGATAAGGLLIGVGLVGTAGDLLSAP